MKIWSIVQTWSILNDRLPIDDMLTDRFYAYIHDSEQKKFKNLQPMKKLILKQTARHIAATHTISIGFLVSERLGLESSGKQWLYQLRIKSGKKEEVERGLLYSQ